MTLLEELEEQERLLAAEAERYRRNPLPRTSHQRDTDFDETVGVSWLTIIAQRHTGQRVEVSRREVTARITELTVWVDNNGKGKSYNTQLFENQLDYLKTRFERFLDGQNRLIVPDLTPKHKFGGYRNPMIPSEAWLTSTQGIQIPRKIQS